MITNKLNKMITLFTIQELKNIAKFYKATFKQQTEDTILIVYKDYTEMYFGNKIDGFKKYYN